MKKAFEFLLVLIIFYGVYAVLNQIAPMLFDNVKSFHVILTSLILAALLLVLYAQVIASEAKADLKQTLNQLHSEIKNKESLIQEKDAEIKRAQSFKDDVYSAAEKTIDIKNYD